jgi:class 3 adenylate cyclase
LKLQSRHGIKAYGQALSRHNAIFEQLRSPFSGMQIIKYTGDGYFATFTTVKAAVQFALLFQHAMRAEPWGELRLASRVGLHVGEVALMEVSGKEDVIGLSASMASRLMSLAVGGQVLLTRMAFDEGRQFVAEHPAVPGDVPAPTLSWMAHGPYCFKGSEDAPTDVFEVGAVGLAPLAPPADSEKAKRQALPSEDPLADCAPPPASPCPGVRAGRSCASSAKAASAKCGSPSGRPPGSTASSSSVSTANACAR